jgi:sarcosine oxidase
MSRMLERHDVAVVGLGAMGSATLCELARRGRRVIGFDAFTPPHAQGSSHGETRIIREAYFEHPLYVPFVQRAYDLWQELERRSGRTLMVRTGGLMAGPPRGEVVSGARASAVTHRLDYRDLSAAQLREEWPAFRLPESMVGVYEPRAGALFPERCIDACLTMAAAAGARLAFDTPVRRWEAADGGTVRVITDADSYEADTLVLCAGAWMRDLSARSLPASPPTPPPAPLSLPLTVERNSVHWFAPQSRAHLFHPDVFPIFLVELEDGRVFYGFPELTQAGPGVKVSRHHQGQLTTIEQVDREIGAAERAEIETWVAAHLPDLAGGWQRGTVCLYTNTPDGHFLIDRHPAHANVWIVSPCSGHGFKFASVIGEAVSDLVMEGRSRFDLAPFRLDRARW